MPSRTDMPASQAPLVIVGGGVAGLVIATALGKASAASGGKLPSVVLIDRDSAHVWKPMLHTIAAGTSDVHQQQTTFVAQAHASHFRYEPGEMCGIDREAHQIQLTTLRAPDGRVLIPARKLRYSKLIIAVGSRANDFGTPGAAQYCHTIDSRLQADAFNQEVRIRLLECLGHEGTGSDSERLSIAIVGGGATGVELAAELIGLAEAAEAYGATGLKQRVSITLIESGPRLLAAFPEDISASVLARLESLGVRVMIDTRVAEVTPQGFVLGDGVLVNASLRVWAAGVKAPDFLATLDGLEVNRSNQLLVLPSLQTTRDPDIYGVGDCASLTPQGADRPFPPTAQVAHQQAQHLIRHLPATLRHGQPLPPFKFRDMGALVSLGDYDAYGSLGKVGMFKGVTFKGRLAQWSHVLLYRSHQAQLHGFWRGSQMWLVDLLNARLRPSIRLD